MYFVDTGFWSKYGQWGNREYYDAATATSPAAAAALLSDPKVATNSMHACISHDSFVVRRMAAKVHAFLDRLAGSRPACVAANSWGRGYGLNYSVAEIRDSSLIRRV